jgi:hypothetical protein
MIMPALEAFKKQAGTFMFLGLRKPKFIKKMGFYSFFHIFLSVWKTATLLQDSRDSCSRLGNQEQESQDRTAETGLTRQDRWDRTTRTEWQGRGQNSLT